MDLLLFLHESIVLCDPAQSKFVHQVDLVGVGHVIILTP